MAQHTPGPWEVTHHKVGSKTLFGVRNQAFGAPNVFPGHLIEEGSGLPDWARGTVLHSWSTDKEADARLIAAAPDLLAACKALYADVLALKHFDTEAGCALLDRVKVAIAKAEGGLGA